MSHRFVRPSGLIIGCCVLLSLSSVNAVTATNAFGLADVMAAMAQVTASRAEFIETKTLAVLTQPLVITGTLAYQRPDRLERQTRSPNAEHMVVEGDRLTLEYGAGSSNGSNGPNSPNGANGLNSPNVPKRDKRSFALALNPVLWAFVESIRATLAGNGAVLEKFYWVRTEGTLRDWTLNLEPRNAQIAAHVQQIRLFGSGPRIERIEVFEANGDRSVTRIKPL